MSEWDFYMSIQDVFSITGRGTVVVGHIEKGQIHIGEEVTLQSTGTSVTVTGIEMFRKTLDSASAGDNVGLLLRGIDKNEVFSGDVLVKGTNTSAYREFYNPVVENTEYYTEPIKPKPVKTGCLFAFLTNK